MRKNKRIIPIIALAVMLVILCTGCGILNTAASLLNKKPADSTPVASDNNTNIAVVPGDSMPATDSAQGSVTDATAPSAGSTAASSQTSATTQKRGSGSQGGTSSAKGTTAPSRTTTLPQTTGADLSNLSVKELQDMLFETKDPNVAGKILTICGFQYDAKQGIYYSSMDPLQRLFGYNIIYDIVAPRTGMIYSTSRIFFDYDGKNWMIQLWKGQYGITSGAEIGLYNKPDDRIIAQYDCASDDELITMQFDFYNQNEYVFSRGPEKHWWLTGFKVFNAGIGFLIDLDINLEFPNKTMANAFEAGLKKAAMTELVDPIKYTRKGCNFNIKW